MCYGGLGITFYRQRTSLARDLSGGPRRSIPGRRRRGRGTFLGVVMAARITTASAAAPQADRHFTLLNEPRAAKAGEPLLSECMMRVRRESPVRPSRGGLLYWHTCQLLTPLLTRRSAATPLARGATAATGDALYLAASNEAGRSPAPKVRDAATTGRHAAS